VKRIKTSFVLACTELLTWRSMGAAIAICMSQRPGMKRKSLTCMSLRGDLRNDFFLDIFPLRSRAAAGFRFRKSTVRELKK